MAATFQVAMVKCRVVTTDFMPPRKERAPPVVTINNFWKRGGEGVSDVYKTITCVQYYIMSARGQATQCRRTRSVEKGRVKYGSTQSKKNLILVVG